MKFICTKDNLLEGLSKVVPLAGRNTQLPILQNILLQLKEGVLHLTGTDLELGIHTIVPGKVEAAGACTVVARQFMEYVQHLPSNNPLELQLKKNSLHVTTTGFKALFPTTPDDDFPLLPQPAGSQQIKLHAAALCQGLNRTIFSAARDNTRPEIHSVFMSSDGEVLTIAATDSFRLAEEVIRLEEGVAPFSFLLPLSTAQEIVRLFSNHDTVTLYPQDNHLAIHGDAVELSSRLVDGKYPDYRQIIPTNFKTTGHVEREELLRALKTLTVFLPRDSRRVQVSVQPATQTLRVAVGGSSSGEGTVQLDFAGTGDDLDILFNIQYLLDGLSFCPGESCQLRFVGVTDPAIFSPAEAEGQYTYVVMPIQV